MRIRSIQTAAVITGAVAGMLAAAAMILASAEAVYIIGSSLVIFLLCFICTSILMRKFVIYKLKPVYQVVHSRNIKTNQLEKELSESHDVLQGIEGEISSWAEKNRREIARLKENEKYRKEYVGNISHEMKTPIFNIQGYILTLLDGALEDQSINRVYLERVEKSIDRLINIVTDLDEINKLESGVLNLQMERFDVVALAREMIEVAEMEAVKKNIKLSVSQAAGPAMYVYASKHYISQVFLNLLINSVKYGVEGGRTVISFIDLYEKVMVEVADNGAGIAQEDIPRVFERFYRTDKSRSRNQGGTGLGLSIVKHIIEAHNESITLRSELGVGSTFSFTLSKNQV